jgi:hypothetical protein
VSTITKVAALPQCDFCTEKARFDGMTTYGPWGNMCEPHFDTYGVGLGTGKGQRLVEEGEDVVMSYSELADLTHGTQVELFGFCSCEDLEPHEYPYEDCGRA